MPCVVVVWTNRVTVSHAAKQLHGLAGIHAISDNTICRIGVWSVSRIYTARCCGSVNRIDEACIGMGWRSPTQSSETAKHKDKQSQARDSPATIEFHNCSPPLRICYREHC